MIVFQSLAIVRSSSYRPCHSPSPGGEGRDEGELSHRGRQSALTCLSALNSKLPIHHPKLSKSPVIKVHSHLITVNNTQSNIFCPPPPPPLFYSTSKAQTIGLYRFTDLAHVKKVRDFNEKKPQKFPCKKRFALAHLRLNYRCHE
jgi:hypothetical protein